MSGQVPRRLKDGKYTQSQPSYWMAGYEGTWYGKEFGAGYRPKDRKWPQGNGYGTEYCTGKKKGTDISYRPNGTQSQVYYTTQGQRRNGRYLPTKGTSNEQGGRGEMKVEMIKRNLGTPNVNLRIKGRKRVIQKILMN